MRTIRTTLGLALGGTLLLVTAAGAAAWSTDPWSAATSIESIAGSSDSLNTAALEGCPFVSQRGDVLYFASNRAGGQGGLDIWYAERTADGGWGVPMNLATVNSPANELCPMAHRNGRTFLFVSARAGGCGGDDLYMTRRHETKGWATPENLGCTVNSAANEASPSLLETELYFSSTRAGGLGDIYVSAFEGGNFGTPALVAALSSAQDDFRPNVRRDGLEIFFDSNRPGGLGGLDIWTSTRASTLDPWTTPTNLGNAVNSSSNDLRASLSWNGSTLYFGSVRAGGEGSQDLYATTR
jgi:Tol biopolymer transport system component